MAKEDLLTKLTIGVGALALGAGVIAGVNSYFGTDTVRTTIVGTDIKRYETGDKYLVNTKAGTFENTDAWYRLKFDSSDVQGDIKGLVGKQVEIEKYGWRIPLFSMYENIVNVKEVK